MNALNVRSERDEATGRILIMIPNFNDWRSLELLIGKLDQVMHSYQIESDLLIVDDGSTIPPRDCLACGSHRSLRRIETLRLRRNLGHQRAIAIGLAHVEAKSACPAVVVMDADGEDDPADVPRLIAKCREEAFEKIVFAERTKRSESVVFRLCYALFKLIHLVLTGIAVRVGNFSVIPRSRLQSLVVVSELWNHYAAAAFKSRQPMCLVPTQRATRLDGRSKMNFVDLVAHGLSAISVYGETIGVRLLVVACLLIVAATGGIAATIVVRLTTTWAIPGWATYTMGLMVVMLLLGVMLAFLFSFIILSGRQGSTFLPCRDYGYFIQQVRVLHEHDPIEENDQAGDDMKPHRALRSQSREQGDSTVAAGYEASSDLSQSARSAP
jgi:glycosyltransferase involved in cell wall biosynthesis